MPRITQILCDGCQATKKEANHWYTLTPSEQNAEIAPLELKPDGRPYSERDGLQQYFCGRSCLLQAITKWMDGLNTGQPSSRPVFQPKSGELFLL